MPKLAINFGIDFFRMIEAKKIAQELPCLQNMIVQHGWHGTNRDKFHTCNGEKKYEKCAIFKTLTHTG